MLAALTSRCQLGNIKLTTLEVKPSGGSFYVIFTVECLSEIGGRIGGVDNFGHESPLGLLSKELNKSSNQYPTDFVEAILQEVAIRVRDLKAARLTKAASRDLRWMAMHGNDGVAKRGRLPEAQIISLHKAQDRSGFRASVRMPGGKVVDGGVKEVSKLVCKQTRVALRELCQRGNISLTSMVRTASSMPSSILHAPECLRQSPWYLSKPHAAPKAHPPPTHHHNVATPHIS